MKERINYHVCPLCESANFTQHHVGDCSRHALFNKQLSPHIVWKKCNDCTHVFTEGYFTEEACRIIFSKTHDNQKLGFKLEESRRISARMVDKVVPHVSDGIWLDIGFGNGSLLFTAQEYGFTPVGVDLRTENVAQLKSLGIESHCEDISSLSLKNQCSVISMMDVLEHMPHPVTGLIAANRLLKKEGVLFLSMPNSENILWDLMTRQNVNPYWGEIEHYHNFSRSRLYALLKHNGFEVVGYGISERYRVCMEVVAKKITACAEISKQPVIHPSVA